MQKLDTTGNLEASGAEKAKLKMKLTKIRNANEQARHKIR